MNPPLLDRAMLLKLLATFTLIGTVAAVLPIPRFDTPLNGASVESPLQREATVRLSVIGQTW